MNIKAVVYAQTTYPTSHDSFLLLNLALTTLLETLNETPKPEVLWTMQYAHRSPNAIPNPPRNHILTTPDVPPSLVLEDDLLRDIRGIWETIVGDDERSGFMTFEDREGVGTEEGEESAF